MKIQTISVSEASESFFDCACLVFGTNLSGDASQLEELVASLSELARGVEIDDLNANSFLSICESFHAAISTENLHQGLGNFYRRVSLKKGPHLSALASHPWAALVSLSADQLLEAELRRVLTKKSLRLKF